MEIKFGSFLKKGLALLAIGLMFSIQGYAATLSTGLVGAKITCKVFDSACESQLRSSLVSRKVTSDQIEKSIAEVKRIYADRKTIFATSRKGISVFGWFDIYCNDDGIWIAW